MAAEREQTSHSIDGAEIVLVGKFLAAPRSQLVQSLRTAGARVARQVTAATTYVVVGVQTWAIRRSGRIPRTLMVARLLQLRQHPVQIVSEVEFFRMRPGLRHSTHSAAPSFVQFVSAAAEADRDVPTAGPLVEWRRARLLADWLLAGIAPQRIDRALRELGRWVPEARHAWEEFVLRWDGRRLVLRLPNGTLCDHTGQLLLDETLDGLPPRSAVTLPLRPDDLFAAAVRAEAEGELEIAEKLYRRCLLEDGPDAHVAFNLANVLVERGQRRGALERLWQSVELAPGFVEAWYNLGLVALELQDLVAARQSFIRTLTLAPEFAAARHALQAMEALERQRSP